MTMPPPTPVPRITPNTTPAPAAAPSTASESAKQLASLARRTGRSSAAARSRLKEVPISQVEFAFLMRPVLGETAPGMPTPTLPRAPASCSSAATSPATAATVAA